MVNRRDFIGFTGLGLGLIAAPRLSFAAAGGDRRLVFIIQRGAADGLGTVIPVADPGLARARAVLEVEGATKLDGMFALHPAMPELAKLYAARQALFVHAVASPYRDRSHFDAQNVLESGGNAPYALKSGWLNRLIGLLPKADGKALALSPTIPMAMRGPADVASYAPSVLPNASSDLIARVGQLYDPDPQLHSLWAQALMTREMAGDSGEALGARNAAASGSLVAKLMRGSAGARIVMVETTGWDTHSQQKGRLAAQLKGLDGLIANLKSGLVEDWSKTLVIVATEFGRTVAANGTGGTDHGTGAVAMMLGGAVKGGRVMADWPGLGTSALYEGRDLRPTHSLDALITGAVSAHFGIDPGSLGKVLFPAMQEKAILI
jgi:uncharacterized protein (DUF1501 family)